MRWNSCGSATVCEVDEVGWRLPLFDSEKESTVYESLLRMLAKVVLMRSARIIAREVVAVVDNILLLVA